MVKDIKVDSGIKYTLGFAHSMQMNLVLVMKKRRPGRQYQIQE
jgi:hypothetical protein